MSSKKDELELEDVVESEMAEEPLKQKKPAAKRVLLVFAAALVIIIVIAILIGHAKETAAKRQLEKDIYNLQEAQKAQSELLEAASSGDRIAQYNMGVKYYDDWNRSYEQFGNYDDSYHNMTFEWLEKAAEQDYVPARAMLCLILNDLVSSANYDVINSEKPADDLYYEWSERTANNHDAYGYLGLGNCFFYGYGVDKDYDKALFLLPVCNRFYRGGWRCTNRLHLNRRWRPNRLKDQIIFRDATVIIKTSRLR